MEGAQILPAWAEIEIALLAGAMLRVKVELAGGTAKMKVVEILIGGRGLGIALKLAGGEFGPLFFFGEDGETETVALAAQADVYFASFVGFDGQRGEEKHIFEHDAGFETIGEERGGGELEIAGAGHERGVIGF